MNENNFTKEELKQIQNCIDEAYRSCCVKFLVESTAREKLKFMINNYCEHDWREGTMGSIYCKKCSKRINFKIQ